MAFQFLVRSISEEELQRILSPGSFLPKTFTEKSDKKIALKDLEEVPLKRNMDGFISYRSNVTGEVIEAKVLEKEDADYTGETLDGWVIGYVYGPRQKNGKVKEHSGRIGVDYLIKGDHYIKVMRRDKFLSIYENVHPL
jgi:hypothetical protein